jgi:hypothetical protein
MKLREGVSLINSILKKLPKTDLVFSTCSHQAKEEIGGLGPGRAAMTVSDFPLHHFFANVQLAGIIMEGCLGERQDRQQIHFLSLDFFNSSIQRIIAGFRLKEVAKYVITQ